MDPNACLQRAADAADDQDFAECREALADLASWRAGGGFAPDPERERAAMAQITAAFDGACRDGIAWWIWAEAFASACDEAECAPWGPGEQIDPHVPEVPAEITEVATKILAMCLARTDCADARALLTLACEYQYADCHDDPAGLGKHLGAFWIGSGAYDLAIDKQLGSMHGECIAEIPDNDPTRATCLHIGGTGV